MGQMKNNPRGALQAKEIQKFFNKVTNIMLMPKDLEGSLASIASIILILSAEDFQNAKDYAINENMEKLLNNKFPKLYINIRNGKAALSIKDENDEIEFLLPDHRIGKPLLRFIETKDWYGKIAVIFAGPIKPNDTLENFSADILIILDGYVLGGI